jgi:hypothetical protein
MASLAIGAEVAGEDGAGAGATVDIRQSVTTMQFPM